MKDEDFKELKTSFLAKKFQEYGIKSALIITGEVVNDNLKKAVANIKHVDLLPVQGANVYDIIRRDNLLLTEAALKKLEERFNG